MNSRVIKEDATLSVTGRFICMTLICLVMVTFIVNSAYSADEEGCLLCHGLSSFGLNIEGGYRSLYVEEDRFNSSRHNQIRCRGCHQTIVALPHDPHKEKVNCGLECHAMVGSSATPYSHESLYWNFLGSIHGQNSRMPITCLDCHPHNPPIQDKASTPRERADVCSPCHLDSSLALSHGLDIQHVKNYYKDVHGRLVMAGSLQAPSCTECHSQHLILSSDQEDSTTNPAQLPATCSGSATSDSVDTCHLESSSSRAAGMTFLVAQSWTDFRIGSIFYYLGLLLSGGLLFRIIAGTFHKR